MFRAAPLHNALQSRANAFVNFGRVEEPGGQSSQIKPGAADQNRPLPSRFDVGDYSLRLFGPGHGGEVDRRLDDVDQVMRDAATLFHRDFGRGYVEAAVDLNGIAVDDLAAEAFGQGDAQIALARRRGTDDRDQRSFRGQLVHHGRLNQR